MRRKSIGATSQAFHEPMSTGAFLEFLTGMQGWGPAQQLKCWSEDGNPASHGTVQLRLRKPTPPNIRSEPVRVAGSRPQGPVGQVLRGLGARASRAWGPAHQGLGAFSPQKPPKPLKWLLRRWGPGGKRSRDTPLPPPPPAPPAFWGCKGERKRVFTLSAFGNHPTRPPRSADTT